MFHSFHNFFVYISLKDGDEDGGEGETAERRDMLRLVQEDLERARQWRP
jgi:hypothetical protein